jgi:hypothetical protein
MTAGSPLIDRIQDLVRAKRALEVEVRGLRAECDQLNKTLRAIEKALGGPPREKSRRAATAAPVLRTRKQPRRAGTAPGKRPMSDKQRAALEKAHQGRRAQAAAARAASKAA